MKKNYLKPLARCARLRIEKNFCASNLSTPSAGGIEGLTEDEEGTWN
ncbi:MAG: hypothetical protein IK045_02655 [Bacteroidales bacterium]|nr:hypothetical protein [Bacteroidales bacterium]